jgi:hypothetical protein
MKLIQLLSALALSAEALQYAPIVSSRAQRTDAFARARAAATVSLRRTALRASNEDEGEEKREIPEQPEYDVEGFGLKQLKEGDPATLVLAGFALILFNFTVLTAATGGGL